MGAKTNLFTVLLRTDAPSVLGSSGDFGAFNISKEVSSCSIAWDEAVGFQVTCTSETPLGIMRGQDGSRIQLAPGASKTLYDEDTVVLDPWKAPPTTWQGLARGAVPNSNSRFAHAIDAVLSRYNIYETMRRLTG